MKPLFSKAGLLMMESLSFAKTLYAFDFDGTLAKIVPVPGDAAMSSRTEQLLRRLSELVPVAVVSGRGVADLRERLGFEPGFLVGNHGLEGLRPDKGSLEQARRISAAWSGALRRAEWPPGVEIEDKAYSLAIHYRRSRNKKEARRKISLAVSGISPPPRVIQGKLVCNLLPPGAPHKGIAVLDLLKASGMSHVFYIGDDDTDEDVFSLPYDSGQVMAVRVGRRRASHAGYFIERQSEIHRLLGLLVRFHADARARAVPAAGLGA